MEIFIFSSRGSNRNFKEIYYFCRAVTTLQNDDEYYIHEFDGSFEEGDHFVLYNVGEVLPGGILISWISITLLACTPLCTTTVVKHINQGISESFPNKPKTPRPFSPSYCGRAFINITTFYELNDGIVSNGKRFFLNYVVGIQQRSSRH